MQAVRHRATMCWLTKGWAVACIGLGGTFAVGMIIIIVIIYITGVHSDTDWSGGTNRVSYTLRTLVWNVRLSIVPFVTHFIPSLEAHTLALGLGEGS